MKFTDYFTPCRPATRTEAATSTAKMTAQEMWLLSAPAGINECLAYSPSNKTFTSRDIYEAVPEIHQVYESSKTLGDRLGGGVAGHGLGLHAKTKGNHLRCRDNAKLFVLGACCPEFMDHKLSIEGDDDPNTVLANANLDHQLVERMLSAMEFETIDELSEVIESLPSLCDLGAESSVPNGLSSDGLAEEA